MTWAEVQEREQQVWLPDQGPTAISLRFTYSAEGPQHVELLQGAPGSIWDGRDFPGVHHLGVWVDDVGKETERLLDAGWTLEMAQVSPDDGFGVFTYVALAERPAARAGVVGLEAHVRALVGRRLARLTRT